MRFKLINKIILPQDFVERKYLAIALILLDFTGAIASQFLTLEICYILTKA